MYIVEIKSFWNGRSVCHFSPTHPKFETFSLGKSMVRLSNIRLQTSFLCEAGSSEVKVKGARLQGSCLLWYSGAHGGLISAQAL